MTLMSKTYKNRSDLNVVFLFWLTVFLAFRWQQQIFSLMPCKSVLNFHFQFLWFLPLFLCFPEYLAIFQEKIKEKESRKTQTFKKDEDKKKKLMQSEVQVSYYLLLVWDSYHTKQLFILFSEVALQSTLVEASVGASIKDGQIPSPYKGLLAKLIHIVFKPFCVTLLKVD